MPQFALQPIDSTWAIGRSATSGELFGTTRLLQIFGFGTICLSQNPCFPPLIGRGQQKKPRHPLGFHLTDSGIGRP